MKHHRFEGKQKDAAFQQWLRGINWESFNVEFTVKDDDLLKKMVQLQLPLPTPLYPGVVPQHASRDKSPVAWFRNEAGHRRDNQRLLKLAQTDESILDMDARPHSHKLRKGRGKKGTRRPQTAHRVDVIARQFRMADGTILSRPALQKRVDVDDLMVRMSQLVLQKGSGIASESSYICRLNANAIQKEQKQYSVLELLRIASCGNLCCRPFVVGRCDMDFLSSVDSWLDPFQRWFTLAQYLAFCYEASLRSMYHESQRGPMPSLAMDAGVFCVGDKGEFNLMCTAVRNALCELLKEESQGVVPFMRDSIFACCLLEPIDEPFKTYKSPSDFFCFPLVDFGAPIGSWKAIVHNEWLLERSTRAEAALMKDNDLSDDTNVMTNTSSEVKVTNSKKSKRKRRKKKDCTRSDKATSNDTTASSQSSTEEETIDAQPFHDVKKNAGNAACGDKIAPVDSNSSYRTAVSEIPLQDEREDEDGFQVVKKGKRAAAPATMRQPAKGKGPSLRQDVSKGDPKREDEALAALDITDDSLFPGLCQLPHEAFKPDPTATLRISNTSSYREAGNDFPLSDILPGYNSGNWILTDFSHFGLGGGWQRETNRGQSILTELLDGQSKFDRDERRIASSTAASIASSLKEAAEVQLSDVIDDIQTMSEVGSASDEFPESDGDKLHNTSRTKIVDTVPNQESLRSSAISEMSPSPPLTPSPTLSPILVSLSDLSVMQKNSIPSFELGQSSLCSDPTAIRASSNQHDSGKSYGSKPHKGKKLVYKHEFKDSNIGASRSFHTRSSRARDDGDLHNYPPKSNGSGSFPNYRGEISRSESARDDTEVRLRVNLEKPDFKPASRRAHYVSPERPLHRFQIETVSNNVGIDRMKISTSRSETALENDEAECNDWQSKTTRDLDDIENSTHVSPPEAAFSRTSNDSQPNHEKLRILLEEKNMFQDTCLTLGAEVAKLRSILAAQVGVFAPSTGMVGFQPNTRYSSVGGQQFDLPFMPESFPIAPRARTMVAMSDAGHRADNESMAGIDDELVGKMQIQDLRQQVSSAATVAESDASLDPSTVYNIYQIPTGIQSFREIHDPIPPHGVRSRLSDDIIQFLENIETKLSKFETKRQMAIERMTRLVKSVWPRAQVNLYGSHATGLCIPSSDLDFVVCLPAVHKNAVAVAPGVLEGRNAINESSQKILARRLKGESWIDPRSMKIIERTTTPVIKVATKDAKTKSLHLDISFEAPGHHGLEAARMITSVMEEIPNVRPLCLVLKQFLIDRGLLEAYTV